MEDEQIIGLYWSRNEEAITCTDAVYGKRLFRLAYQVLYITEDAEECVEDTYMNAWNAMPPGRPNYLYAFLAKICRNCAFGILDKRGAEKRRAEVVCLTQEMEMCIPDHRQELAREGAEIGEALNSFLATLTRENRILFMRRYWYLDTIEQISRRCGMSQSKVKTRLFRIREKLRAFLEKEGISL